MTDAAPAAFEVRMPGGHVYKVFADGHTEGFCESSSFIVVNRIPDLTRQAYAEGIRDAEAFVKNLDALADSMADFEAKAS